MVKAEFLDKAVMEPRIYLWGGHIYMDKYIQGRTQVYAKGGPGPKEKNY